MIMTPLPSIAEGPGTTMSNYSTYKIDSQRFSTIDTVSCSDDSSFCSLEDDVELLPKISLTKTTTRASTQDVLVPKSILKKTKPNTKTDVAGKLPNGILKTTSRCVTRTDTVDEELLQSLAQQVNSISFQPSTRRSNRRRNSANEARFKTESERRQRAIDVKHKWHKTHRWSLLD
mmetsp:Transcript_1128/g.2262  ORF Transcript_1128/g.2262 Transcript_1128/m.2262 type:complete len:175 (+) Transcript_1128:241-765(+)